jgi:type VI protein secretion system component VasK
MGKVLHWLVILTLASAAFPLNPSRPEWYLRLGDASVGNAPVLLLMFLMFLLLLTRVFQGEKGLEEEKSILRMSRLWSILFAVIVPLQVACFVWLWVGSGSQVQQQIQEAKVQMNRLKHQVDASGDVAQLNQVLANANNGRIPSLPMGSLTEQKQQLRESIGFNFTRLQAELNNSRNRMLSDRLPGVLRTAIGAALISRALKAINSSLRDPRDSLDHYS